MKIPLYIYIYIYRVGRNASTHLQGLQGPPLLYMYDIYQVEAFLLLKSLQVKHILYILRGGGYFLMLIVQLNIQLIPNYFKNEKFVKLNTIITNDNVHEEVKYFSCQKIP